MKGNELGGDNNIYGGYKNPRPSVPSKNHRILIPKAICILSRYPFYDYFSRILDDIYNASRHHVINILEAFINKLVLEVR